MEILKTLANWAQVAIGLGFVIFLHELGHFLLAKWNDVKVEKFSIGFGPAFLKFRRGETEYALSAIPLGGYVKMLGEGEELQTSSEAPSEADLQKASDPRAYPNKPVGARMAIISAGVIMNLILGIVCFVIAYGHGGLPFTPAIIGAVVAGQPAYEAGLRPGDEVIAVDDREGMTVNEHLSFDYADFRQITAMSGPGQTLHLTIQRPGVARPFQVNVTPVREENSEVPAIGVMPSDTLVLTDPPILVPTGLAEVDSSRARAIEQELKPGDRIVALAPKGEKLVPVENVRELNLRLTEYRDQPLTLALEREKKASENAKRADKKAGTVTERVEVTLPPAPLVELGVRMTMGTVVGIRPDSPASRAGFEKGDLIVEVDGQRNLDPLHLPELFLERAGRDVAVTVMRSEGGGKPAEPIALMVRPETLATWTEPVSPLEPVEVPAIGLGVAVSPKVAAVMPGSPAARAGLEPGMTVTSISLTWPSKKEGEKPRQESYKLGEEVNWTFTARELLQTPPLEYLPVDQVAVTVAGIEAPMRMKPEVLSQSWHDPRRGLILEPIIYPLPPLGVAASVERGTRYTFDIISSILTMFRRLAEGRVSTKALGGPFMIAAAASHFARNGMVEFIRFLGLLSVNLAVINFLPIPPLDGGQMAFLIAEKVRGRPLPEKALAAGTYAGLLLVLSLMGFIIFQDIIRFVWG